MKQTTHPRSLHVALALWLGSSAIALAQADPAAVSPEILTPVTTAGGLNYELPEGTFRYGLTGSEVLQWGYANGTIYNTNLSGNVAYSTKSVIHPFSAVYSGGVELSNQAEYGTTFFQGLSLTQSYLTRDWTFLVSNSVNYLPQSPTVGLSGIPGTGDLGLNPVSTATGPAQNVLTYNSTRVSDTVTGLATRRLTGRTSVSGDAIYTLLHFFNDASLDTRQIAADLTVSHQLDARTSIGAGANYSIFNYDAGDHATFETRSLSVQGHRQLSASLSIAGSVGPQWINSSANLGIPSRLTTSARASLTYAKRFGTAAVSYGRGTNGGSGVLPGAISDSVSGAFSRSFGLDWSAAVNAGYSRTKGLGNGSTPNLSFLGLANYGNFSSVYGGAQANRRLTRSLSAFATYTAIAQDQSDFGAISSTVPGALNGILQSFAIGVSFYPRSLIPGQF